MAHFAKLDDNNIVIDVLVVSDVDTSDNNGNEVESIGVSFCQKLVGDESTVWKQTSLNAKGNGFRGNYAGVGHTYMTNVMGTLHMLEAPRELNQNCIAASAYQTSIVMQKLI